MGVVYTSTRLLCTYHGYVSAQMRLSYRMTLSYLRSPTGSLCTCIADVHGDILVMDMMLLLPYTLNHQKVKHHACFILTDLHPDELVSGSDFPCRKALLSVYPWVASFRD